MKCCKDAWSFLLLTAFVLVLAGVLWLCKKQPPASKQAGEIEPAILIINVRVGHSWNLMLVEYTQIPGSDFYIMPHRFVKDMRFGEKILTKPTGRFKFKWLPFFIGK